MAVMSVDLAEPGMVLAAAVRDRQGRLLIPEGKELTDRHVNALRMWGVTHIEVDREGDDDESLAAVEPEYLQRAGEHLERHFGRVGRDHPFLALLFDYCVVRKALQLQKEEADDAA